MTPAPTTAPTPAPTTAPTPAPTTATTPWEVPANHEVINWDTFSKYEYNAFANEWCYHSAGSNPGVLKHVECSRKEQFPTCTDLS